jgi:hypothetical protein
MWINDEGHGIKPQRYNFSIKKVIGLNNRNCRMTKLVGATLAVALAQKRPYKNVFRFSRANKGNRKGCPNDCPQITVGATLAVALAQKQPYKNVFRFSRANKGNREGCPNDSPQIMVGATLAVAQRYEEINSPQRLIQKQGRHAGLPQRLPQR